MTRRDWFVKGTVVPFSFTRGCCAFCDAPAMGRIGGEPVCERHLATLAAIKADAILPERERERIA